MDCLFNKRVPKSTNIKIIIPPAGKTFITGFAKSYKDEFPEELELYKISKEEYAECMKDINELLQHYWPCKTAIYCGYIFAPCTLCFSLYVPNYCISGAEHMVKFQIRQANKHLFEKKGLKMRLVKTCSTSWLEINQFDENAANQNAIKTISTIRNQITGIIDDQTNQSNQHNIESENNSLMSDFMKA